jgi:glycerol kinase
MVHSGVSREKPPVLSKKCVLSIDEGTTSARAALYNDRGERIAMHAVPVESRYPKPGWVEQDGQEIWQAQMSAVRAVLEAGALRAFGIAACGVTNQRETTVVWDRLTGKPIAPAIVWQCRRTAEMCGELARSSDAGWIERKTGLVIDAYFSASKIRWILENVPHTRAKAGNGEILFGTVDTWLIWNLTGGKAHATDVTNASRTMLMDLATGEWDDELLRIFDIPRAMLPEIVPSAGRVGIVEAGLPGAGIPISGIAGDQQAALAGQACFRAGLSKNTYGTGCFALTHTGDRQPHSKHRLLSTRAAAVADSTVVDSNKDRRPQFAVEGSVFVAGAVIQWLRDELGLIRTSGESGDLAASVPDSGGVYVVPAFVGLGAPHWDSQARGMISGLTRASTKAHIVRAALESIALQSMDLIDAMEADSGEPVRELRVDGGAAVNNFLMQFQADILDKRVVRPADVETTALGAAYLAGIAEGVWSGTAEVEGFWRIERCFEPQMPADRRTECVMGWRRAVARAGSELRQV